MKSSTVAPDPDLAREALELIDGCAQRIGKEERERLRGIVMADRMGLWEGRGHGTYVEWLSARHGVSNWKARRWITTAYALEKLPSTAAALSSGALHLDKVMELARFATPADEEGLIKWARKVNPGTIRKRADRRDRALEDPLEVHDARYLRTWDGGDGSMRLEGLLPYLEGVRVRKAIDRLARALPDLPAAEDGSRADAVTTMEQKRADALSLMAAARIADDQDPDRATVVCFLEESPGGSTTSYLEDGTGLPPAVREKLWCSARVQPIATGKDGDIGIGRTSQITSSWLRRLVLQRDGGVCAFPGCEMKMFLNPHHIEHWTPNEGETQLPNLVTLCTSHHTLVHEGRWSVILDPVEGPIFFRPSGRRYDPGPPGVDERMQAEAERELETRTVPHAPPLEKRYGWENFKIKELSNAWFNDLYEIAKNLAGV